MILKGSQRANGNELAAHLMNDRDNDHVTLFELRGFLSGNLKGAFQESEAISKGTRCQQYLFSLSLNPPKDADASEQELVDAANRAEEALGLKGQPRAVVFHDKEGRRHAHAVWSRIDARTMTAINLPHFKRKLASLSRDLYLDHGWDLPDGLKRGGGKSPLNFTLAEWQQAKRIGLDPREIKQAFKEAWERSDTLKAFKHALEERGYFLARGDRRGFVAVDTHGEVYAVARYAGVKTKEVRLKLGDADQQPSVATVKDDICNRLNAKLRTFIAQVDDKHKADMQPLADAKADMVQTHREERSALYCGQAKRWNAETRDRSSRLNTGLRGLWQTLSGAASKIKAQNLDEALACAKRDQKQRDALVLNQMRERQQLQDKIVSLRKQHARNRTILYRDISQAMKPAHGTGFDPPKPRARDHAHFYRGPTI
jgi:hypothetical protein